MSVNLTLGTMTFGQQAMFEEAAEMVKYYLKSGYNEFDTAYVYNEGECEKILGDIFKEYDRKNFKVDTKVNPRISGRLDADAVRKQLPESLERMKVDYVDTLFLHFPDPKTPIEDALEECDRFYRDGKFKELGLSNFPAWMVADAYHKCKAHGWVLPTVYEGLYNPLSRKAETELFDALRAFNMRFYAYNPLAGGLLTGKYTSVSEKPQDGRFALRKAYSGRYWNESFFEATDIIREACGEMNMVEVTYRWLAFHSALDGNCGDSIIIGASKMSQLKQNIEALKKGELPEKIVEAFEKAWDVSKIDSPEYFTLFKG